MLKTYVAAQTALLNVKDRLKALHRDESGAALIEYSLLIGLITVGAAATIVLVGPKVATYWTNLNTNLK